MVCNELYSVSEVRFRYELPSPAQVLHTSLQLPHYVLILSLDTL